MTDDPLSHETPNCTGLWVLSHRDNYLVCTECYVCHRATEAAKLEAETDYKIAALARVLTREGSGA